LRFSHVVTGTHDVVEVMSHDVSAPLHAVS